MNFLVQIRNQAGAPRGPISNTTSLTVNTLKDTVHDENTYKKRTQREHESTSRAPRLLAATESMYLSSCRPWGRGRCSCTPPACLLCLGDRELPAAGCGVRSACIRSTSPLPGHTSPLLPAGSTNLVLSAALGAVCCSSTLPGRLVRLGDAVSRPAAECRSPTACIGGSSTVIKKS